MTLIGLVLAGCQSAATEASQDDEMATENGQAIEPALKTRDFDEVTGLIEKLAVATLNEMETYGYASVHTSSYNEPIDFGIGEVLAAESNRWFGLWGPGETPLCLEDYRAITRTDRDYEDVASMEWQLTNLLQEGLSAERWKELFRSIDVVRDFDANSEALPKIDYWLLSESGILWVSEEAGYLAVVGFNPGYAIQSYAQIDGEQKRIMALGERWRENPSVEQLLALTNGDPALHPRTLTVSFPKGDDVTALTDPHSLETWSALVSRYPLQDSISELKLQEALDDRFFGSAVWFNGEVATPDASSLGALYLVKDATSERGEILAVDEVAPAYGADGEPLTCTPPR